MFAEIDHLENVRYDDVMNTVIVTGT